MRFGPAVALGMALGALGLAFGAVSPACVVYDASLLVKDAGVDADAGPCRAGMTLCSGSCVDLQTSATSCGACGHACKNQDCTGGLCIPDVLASSLPGPRDILVDDTYVYFGNHDSVSTQRVGKDGSGLVLFGGPQVFPGQMVLSNGQLYWTNDSNLKGVLLSMATAILPSDVPNKLAVDLAGPAGLAVVGGDAFIAMGAATNASGNGCATSAYVGQIVRCPVGGCQVPACGGGGPIAVATGQSAPHALAADAKAMVWATDDGTIHTCPTPGCGTGPTPLITGQSGVGAIVLDNANVYFTTATSVASCDRASCTSPTALASGLKAPRRIALSPEGSTIYFTVEDTLQRCTLPSCAGGPVVLARKLPAPWGLAVDASYVYVACEGTTGSTSVDGSIVAVSR